MTAYMLSLSLRLSSTSRRRCVGIAVFARVAWFWVVVTSAVCNRSRTVTYFCGPDIGQDSQSWPRAQRNTVALL